jgi:phosphoenolpyruvate synthase/pyruvate phosphate dikinase
MSDEIRVAAEYVLFTCHGKCGAKDVRVAVVRRGPEQDVVSWLRDVSETLANHHQINWPWCYETKYDLKIPLQKESGT